MAEQSKELRCFWIDDHDFYAAHDEAEARRLHCEMCGLEDSDIDDCVLVVGAMLDIQWCGEEDPEKPIGTLRQWLAEATEPCWLSGTE
ncbi:hypothetical protein [Pseudomonas sp. zfem003]|uniref:hypothetical protein n=1 Tax=Pseudomonas sp. zfem003 TaxID=3078198 RepID=UPI002927A599|nr:hypothetical protein [Pseudomonas sp. zfem003]MDU9398070.1 hypothetical protein [Pseudomonas sp. zfem003]